MIRHVPRTSPTVTSVIMLVIGTAALGLAPTADAAARVSVSSDLGASRAASSGPTTLTLSGRGFQSIPQAMGGIYVFFGTVDDPDGGSWRPSRGGASGSDFRYIPDSESRNNRGFQRFVAFPGSETSDAANGGQLSSSGGWGTSLTVPGPVITVTGRGGSAEQVDCRRVTCGVITVGAHGVKNATNETFTPVRFGDTAASGGSTSKGTTGSSTTTAPAASATPSASASPAPTEPLTVGVDGATAVAGRVMSFTARGFQVGEQVTATLGDGLAAVGPLVAGSQGEVASVIQLPGSLRIGTHTLKVTGAASGRVALAEVPIAVAEDVAPVAAGLSTPTTNQTAPTAWLAVAGAALVLLLVVLVGTFGALRDRRAARPGGAA